MTDTPKEVTVQVSDLQAVQAAVSNLRFLAVSLDLVDTYRKLDDRQGTSPAANQADEALTKLQAMLQSVEESN